MLRKDEHTKSDQTPMKPLKGKIASETGLTVETSEDRPTENQILQKQTFTMNKNRRNTRAKAHQQIQ